MGKGKRKKIKIKEKFVSNKEVKFSPKSQPQRFSWTYRVFDRQGPFKVKKGTKVNLEDIFQKKKNFETLNSSDLGKQGSHFVSTQSLSKEAQKRLKFLKQDDFENLFSFRITGQQRLWCIKLEESLMGILWWDPEHKVCPSKKRNT